MYDRHTHTLAQDNAKSTLAALAPIAPSLNPNPQRTLRACAPWEEEEE